ncbi:MAG: hypothetical protein WBP64_13080 [Nitrososphaeraceae archaeon]
MNPRKQADITAVNILRKQQSAADKKRKHQEALRRNRLRKSPSKRQNYYYE